MFDGLGVGVVFCELLRGALDVGTHVLKLRGYLLLESKLLEVDRVVGIGGDCRVGVLLPCVGLRPADDDLDAVVLDSAGKGLTETAVLDEALYGFLYLRAEALEGCLVLVSSDLCCEKLVDDVVVLGCAKRELVF